MKLKRLKKIVYSLLTISLVLLALKQYLFYSSEQKHQIPLFVQLQDGDIILRKESNRISDIFANINNSKYSHVGTVAILNKQVKIIHIEETSDLNDFKISDINEFITYASNYAIYRPNQATNKDELVELIKILEKDNPSFDMEFKGDDNDNRIYCTELAYKLYNGSTKNKLKAKKVNYMNYNFIPVTLFYEQKHFKLLYKFI